MLMPALPRCWWPVGSNKGLAADMSKAEILSNQTSGFGRRMTFGVDNKMRVRIRKVVV